MADDNKDEPLAVQEDNKDEKEDNKDEEKSSIPFKLERIPKEDPGDGLPTKPPDVIEFKWNKEMTTKKQCDTQHILYLLQLALNLVRLRTIERNKYFKSIGRTDRYINQLDNPQIIRNFLDWHNKDKDKNKFDGQLLENAEKLTMINDYISTIGEVLKKNTSVTMEWINSLKKTKCLSFMTGLRKMGIKSVDDYMNYNSKDGKWQISHITKMTLPQINQLFMACNEFDTLQNGNDLQNKNMTRNNDKAMKGKKKKRETKKSKQTQTASMHFDSSDNDDNIPFDGTAWIYDSFKDTMTLKCVAQTKKCITLVPLSSGNSNDIQVRGGRALEENGFSCGLLEIPPGCKKDSEAPLSTETFFVHQCENKMLLFKVGDDNELYLSTGTMFFVPPENEYELINLSKTHVAQLIFTLIRNDECIDGDDDDDDTQSTLNTTT